MSVPPGVVASLNVGATRSVAVGRRTVETAIWKTPVAVRILASGVNLVGDDQADRGVHGGPDKAVYAYGVDDYAWWEAELGHPLDPGTFGENLTIAGMAVSAAVVGERWAVGSAVFEVSQPRTPCGKLGIRMGDPQFPRRFAHAGRPGGAYLRIALEGIVGAGDEVSVVHRPTHGLTVAAVGRAAEGDRTLLPDLLTTPELADGWVSWAVEQAVKDLQRDPCDDRLLGALRSRLVLAGADADRADSVLVELVGSGSPEGDRAGGVPGQASSG
jgi:MOSC domain-containing protein YiiM